MERLSQNDGFTADGMEFTGCLARKTRNKNADFVGSVILHRPNCQSVSGIFRTLPKVANDLVLGFQERVALEGTNGFAHSAGNAYTGLADDTGVTEQRHIGNPDLVPTRGILHLVGHVPVQLAVRRVCKQSKNPGSALQFPRGWNRLGHRIRRRRVNSDQSGGGTQQHGSGKYGLQ